jgi:hypothetical protein
VLCDEVCSSSSSSFGGRMTRMRLAEIRNYMKHSFVAPTLCLLSQPPQKLTRELRRRIASKSTTGRSGVGVGRQSWSLVAVVPDDGELFGVGRDMFLSATLFDGVGGVARSGHRD